MSMQGRKRPFEIDEVMAQIRAAVEPFPKAAMFELAERGYNSPFEQLIACIISIRTYDETSIPVAEELFALARTPGDKPLGICTDAVTGADDARVG